MWENGRRAAVWTWAARMLRTVTPPRWSRMYRERPAFRRQVRHGLVWGVLATLAYAFLFADGGLASIVWRQVRIHQLQRRVAQLERREAWLQREIALRQDDPRRIERLARERYGLAYPGEKVYRIVEVSEAEAQRIERRKHHLQQQEAAPVEAGAAPPAAKTRRPATQRRAR
jgi:cell division protein FtsB